MAHTTILTLYIYDIVDNKRRSRLVKTLNHYLQRVQKSAFEGPLTPHQYQTLLQEALSIINPLEDSLRIYKLDNHTQVQTYGVSIDPLPSFIIL